MAPTEAPTQAPTLAPTPDLESTPTPAATATTPAATPTGEVQGETGAPQITPPSTDTAIGGTSSPTGTSWTPLLLIAAGVLALSLVLTPASRRTKR